MGLKDAFVAECASLGITVTATEGYAEGDKDFRGQMTNIASANPDVIFCPNYYEDDGMIVTQARQVGVKGTFLGGDGFSGISGYAAAVDLEGSVYCSAYASGASEALSTFETEYVEIYSADAPLNMFAATGYDAAVVMVNALTVAEQSGAEAGSEEYKQAVIDAIRDRSSSLPDAVTSSGYTFDESSS